MPRAQWWSRNLQRQRAATRNSGPMLRKKEESEGNMISKSSNIVLRLWEQCRDKF